MVVEIQNRGMFQVMLDPGTKIRVAHPGYKSRSHFRAVLDFKKLYIFRFRVSWVDWKHFLARNTKRGFLFRVS